MNNVLNDKYVRLPNDFYDNLDISNEEMTVLTLMYRNYMQYKSLGVCSIQMICDFMRINVSNNRKLVATIKDTIVELVSKGYVTNLYNIYYENCDDKNIPLSINSIIKDKDTIFYVELVKPPADHYFEIYDQEINYILKELASKNLNKFNIIRYFIACRRVSNNDSNFGYLTQSKLKQLINDSRTITRYNAILQDDLHLIRYNNNFLTEDKHYCTTYIGHWDDENNFNKQLQVEVESKGLIPTDKVKSNKRRSKKQEINYLVNEKDIKIKELEDKVKQYEALQHKVKDNPFVDVHLVPKSKLKGLQNAKTIVDDFPDLFNIDDEESFNELDILSDEEQRSNQECINANNDQVPDDVLRMIEDELNQREK